MELPQGDEWKDVRFIQGWKRQRREELAEKVAGDPRQVPRSEPVITPADLSIRMWERIEWHSGAEFTIRDETILERAHREEGPAHKPNTAATDDRFRVPNLIAKDGDDWILSPIAERAPDHHIEKAKCMYELGLTKKAHRQIGCHILGGEIPCKGPELGIGPSHHWRVDYACGLRYCDCCGPELATQLFKRHHDKLKAQAQRLMKCQHECAECDAAIARGDLPHWPPRPGAPRPRVVCVKFDFTLRHDRGGKVLPSPDDMRSLNRLIKKFFRAMEKRFGIKRSEYGFAYCDEFGKDNANPHAHGIYVGPWLPQKKKQLSGLWFEITGDSFILWIKKTNNFSAALHHAVKYPNKITDRSNPKRLAELEATFHRVRRFHTLAKFYRCPDPPESKEKEAWACPCCGAPLGESHGLQGVEEMKARGLPDLMQVRREKKREMIFKRIFGAESPPL